MEVTITIGSEQRLGMSSVALQYMKMFNKFLEENELKRNVKLD